MGAFSIWHLAILVLPIPFGLAAFLPLLIKPSGPNRFGPPAEPQSFPSAFVTCLKKYVGFNGRARRSEFWWYRLGVVLILAVAAVAVHGSALTDLVSLAFFLPDLAVSSRRLHDLNRSAWWILLAFTGFGLISLIILWAWPSQKDDQAQVF